MGRIKSITPLVCRHSHFTYEERLQLEFHLSGTGKLPRITNKVMLGTLLNKHPRTISREIKRGQAEHFFDEGFQTKTEYNADYAEMQAREKGQWQGTSTETWIRLHSCEADRRTGASAQIQPLCNDFRVREPWMANRHKNLRENIVQLYL